MDKQNNSTPAATEVEIKKHLKDLPESVQIAILANIEKAKKAETVVGIDPESYLAKEILWQSRKLINITHALNELAISLNQIQQEVKRFNQEKYD
ncbi:hypothetical protein FZC70_05475 [Bacillus subtilis]|nr:hypothetical protein [Bacillus subtilis]TYS10740.1 hypothetical protein FZC70_05475 [Bacillus subtilis]